MAHFAVAHESGGEAHGETRGVYGGGPLGVSSQLVHDGSGRILDRIALHTVADAPPVNHYQTDLVLRRGHSCSAKTTVHSLAIRCLVLESASLLVEVGHILISNGAVIKLPRRLLRS